MNDSMGGMFWWIAALTFMAAVFVFWPLFSTGRKSQSSNSNTIGSGAELNEELNNNLTESEKVIAERIALNNALYDESLKDIDSQHERGELTLEESEKLKIELRSQLNQDNDIKITSKSFGIVGGKWLVIASAILVPLFALVLYWERGQYLDWEIDSLIKENNRLQQRQATKAQIESSSKKLLAKLENRVKQKPDNLNNQIMLARTAFELQEFQKAIAAYQNILDERPNSPQVLSELAQVIYISSGSRFLAPVKELFDRALSIEPNNVQILSLAGFDAYQAGSFQQAIEYWERLLKTLPPSDQRYATWSQALAEAKSKVGLSVAESDVKKDGQVSADLPADAPFINVSVSLSDDVKLSVSASETVFIYARAAKGPKMPLAMQRLTVADLPVTVRLDETTAMAAGMTIKQFPQLEVIARVSKSGNAATQSGDWQAISSPLTTAPNLSVELMIDSKIP
ncbi:MAG: c-type cytochrome biogenesis protein CcmI [Cellvibrionaceae bacterium]